MFKFFKHALIWQIPEMPEKEIKKENIGMGIENSFAFVIPTVISKNKLSGSKIKGDLPESTAEIPLKIPENNIIQPHIFKNILQADSTLKTKQSATEFDIIVFVSDDL